ncbi:MAG: hypothetical protein NUV91_09445 [Candidatus Omnitrophica bacterium]|nr:hypothetical protein [Candidatus Omnitrophota bacterium]
MYKYLKEEPYYSDLYDLLTIKECLRIRENKNQKDLEDKKIKSFLFVLNLQLYVIKGERYRNKRETIQKWMEADKRCDEKLVNTQEPKNIYCPNCSEVMKVISKDLYNFSIDSSCVLFLFECPKCGKRRGVFENGNEYVSKGVKLSKSEIKKWDKEDAERKDRAKSEQELLKIYRTEFCLSDVEGQEYILDSNLLKEFAEYSKEKDQKEADPDYQEAMKLNKLTIVELENLLKKVLEKEKYINLIFDKPIIDKHVIVPLTVQEADSSRKEYDSVHKLQRLFKKTLKETNWRLMSEGVDYRLGYLFCRLKGYEREHDLVEIVKLKKFKN